MKVYISGPITGMKNNNRQAFNEAETKLKFFGYSVFNPAWFQFDETWNWGDIVAFGMDILSKCDAIYQLPGWEKSKGAVVEDSYAKGAGMIYIRDDFLQNTIARGTRLIFNKSASVDEFLKSYQYCKEVPEIVTTISVYRRLLEGCNFEPIATRYIMSMFKEDLWSYAKIRLPEEKEK